MSKNTSLAGYLRSTVNIVLFELQILLANILHIQLLETHLSTRNERARDFKMEVFRSDFGLVVFKESALNWKIISLMFKFFWRYYHLPDVTGIRFCDTTIQTLPESQNMSKGFLT